MVRPVAHPVEETERGVISTLTIFRTITVSLILCVALPVFLGWLIPGIGRILPASWDKMKANTAALMLLSTASVILTQRRRRLWQRRLGRSLGGVILLFATIMFLEYFGVRLLRIDTLFAADPHSAIPGRPSIQACIGFMLIGPALGSLGTTNRMMNRLADAMALLLCLFVLSFFGSIFFNAEGLPGWSLQEELSPQTFFCLTLLMCLILQRRTEFGLFSILAARGIGGKTARLTAPMAIVLPFAIAALRATMVRLHLLRLNYAIAIAPAIAAVVALCFVMVLARRNRDLERALHNLSIRDELTGLYNRRGFNLLAGQAFNEIRRAREHFSIAFFDIDNLKEINDTRGHENGSQLLKEFALLLRQAFRETDIIGRLGGDEFVIAGKAAADEFSVAVQRLQRVSARQRGITGPLQQLSYSCGVASLERFDETLDDIIDRADTRMYEAKRARKALA